MVRLKVSEADKLFAKKQISAFEKISAGSWRYANVEAWRGIVCEILTSRWLEKHFQVNKPAKGLDNSGIVDDCDLIISGKKIEIKSATKYYFKYIMPKIHDLRAKPKDIYIGVKYDETISPHEIEIIGYLERDKILEFPVEKNKGAPYYKVPLSSLKPIECFMT